MKGSAQQQDMHILQGGIYVSIPGPTHQQQSGRSVHCPFFVISWHWGGGAGHWLPWQAGMGLHLPGAEGGSGLSKGRV
jgi:hypothetical protein